MASDENVGAPHEVPDRDDTVSREGEDGEENETEPSGIGSVNAEGPSEGKGILSLNTTILTDVLNT